MKQTYEYKQAKHVHNFKKVSNPENWKMPTMAKTVNTLLEAHHIQEAVVHFTGGIPDVSKSARVNDGVKYVVHASAGYYVEIGA